MRLRVTLLAGAFFAAVFRVAVFFTATFPTAAFFAAAFLATAFLAATFFRVTLLATVFFAGALARWLAVALRVAVFFAAFVVFRAVLPAVPAPVLRTRAPAFFAVALPAVFATVFRVAFFAVFFAAFFAALRGVLRVRVAILPPRVWFTRGITQRIFRSGDWRRRVQLPKRLSWARKWFSTLGCMAIMKSTP